MDIKRLEIFGVVAQEGSVTRAAEKLFTSQPAVSMQIKLLETETGIKLFERAGRAVRLTREGQLLYASALKIQQGLKEADEIVSDIRGLKTGFVHIGASTTPGIYLLPEVIGQFKKKHPQVQVRLLVANTEAIFTKIQRGEVHVGFVGTEDIPESMTAEGFVHDHIIPVLPHGHALLKKKTLSMRALAKEPFILREEGSGTRGLLERKLRGKNLTLENVVMEIGNTEGIKRAVAAGLGISFLSYFSVAEELRSGKLRTMHVKDFTLRRQLSQVVLAKAWRSPSVKVFLDFCKTCREKLSQTGKTFNHDI